MMVLTFVWDPGLHRRPVGYVSLLSFNSLELKCHIWYTHMDCLTFCIASFAHRFVLWTCSTSQTQERVQIVEMHWSHSAFWELILIHITWIYVCMFVCLFVFDWVRFEILLNILSEKGSYIKCFDLRVMCIFVWQKDLPVTFVGVCLFTTSWAEKGKLTSLLPLEH